MATMLVLTGEQPLPLLLPIRFLKPERVIFLHSSKTKQTASRVAILCGGVCEFITLPDVYDPERIRQRIEDYLVPSETLNVNISGGTKMMTLAAVQAAKKCDADLVYLRTEGTRRRQQSRLETLVLDQDRWIRVKSEVLPELINLDDYLRVNIGHYQLADWQETAGTEFEIAVSRTLQPEVDEILCNVVPDGVKDQVEIDLLARCGNQVAVFEIKRGGRGSGKHAIDQLTTASAREYLGTYALRFLVTGAVRDQRFVNLAQRMHIRVINLPAYQTGKTLSKQDRKTLLKTVGEYLALRAS
ncbi:MAG: hypothetical protein P1S60_15450 [Anaerolineae bacterium]|nr:hypothetical protein [Anaerolineae bacterium]